METVWTDDSHHARFLRALKRRRADDLLSSPARLQDLRFNWSSLMNAQRVFAPVFQERGIDFPEFVIQNTRATRKAPETKRAELLPLPDFDFTVLPASEHTIWTAWCPIQSAFSRHGLFLPTDLFELLGSYMAEPERPASPQYDCELEDEWTLPGLKLV